LLCLAQTQGLPSERVDQVISMAGLSTVARRRAGGFSLGMSQRLGIAAALLGDPGVLILDEPVNGLDPEGVLWIRNLMKRFAADGRTVFVSSHLMNEMAVTADHLIVIGQGRLLADCPTAEFVDCNSKPQVLVKTSGAAQLTQLVTSEGAQVSRNGTDVLTVTGVPAPRIADVRQVFTQACWPLRPKDRIQPGMDAQLLHPGTVPGG
jgi:ABC-2 type transport system ATP-binding protein